MSQTPPKSLWQFWASLSPKVLPFADAATKDLPLGRLLRLSLFQVSVGMALVLLNATLNRVMIVELQVSAGLVAAMVALPLLFAPARILIGHRSDTHKSYLGLRRLPYIWIGSMLQFGGLAIMPFALILLSGDTTGPAWVGHAGGAIAFLMVGAGLHTTQTSGLALATDLADDDNRPRVVALLYVMLLVGMVISALIIGWLLSNFSQLRLIQVIQGAAVVTIVLNMIALWKQEARQPSLTKPGSPRPQFKQAWSDFVQGGSPGRLLVAVGLGAAAFSMQDVLLEPYGGEVLGLDVSATTVLTALMSVGTLIGFGLAARWLTQGRDACQLAAWGAVTGLVAFPLVILAEPFASSLLFRAGTILIGFGNGLFAVGTLTAAMRLANTAHNGLALGAWGAVQATASGLAIVVGGATRDLVSGLATSGALGPLNTVSAGYMFVYHVEIILVFLTLMAIGPLVRHRAPADVQPRHKFGLAEMPG